MTGPNGNPATCNPLTTSGLRGHDLQRLRPAEPGTFHHRPQFADETQYTYDADGTMLTETEPSSTVGTYTYNGAGQGDPDLLHRRDADRELPV